MVLKDNELSEPVGDDERLVKVFLKVWRVRTPRRF
jgi:hypothetical protein